MNQDNKTNGWRSFSLLRVALLLLFFSLPFSFAQVIASSDLLSSLFKQHGAVMLFIEPDSGRIIDANAAAVRFYGLSLEELKRSRIQDFNVLDADEVAMERQLAVREERSYFVFPHRSAGNQIRTVEVYSSPVRLEDGRQVLFSVIHDITGKAVAEEELLSYKDRLEQLVDDRSQALLRSKDAQRRLFWSALLLQTLAILALLLVMKRQRESRKELRKLTLAVEQSPDSIVITDIYGTIEYVNGAFERVSGYSRDEVIGENPRILQSGKTPREVYEQMWSALRNGESWRGELLNRSKQGVEFTEAVTIAPVFDEQGRASHFLAIKQDVTEKLRTEQKLHELAFYDVLTGLPNRSLLFDRIKQALAAGYRLHHQEALLLFNIDRFKMINEAHGLRLGDQLLKEVGDRLQVLLRDGDTVARTSGDEFAVLLPDINNSPGRASRHALVVAEKIHRCLREPFHIQGEHFAISVSIGITTFPESLDSEPASIVRRAETALHRAKAAGGNQTAFFEVSMGEKAINSFNIERELRQAIVQDDLCLYLQPQVNAQGDTTGAEVLVRWLHASRGLMMPGQFIPIAEESDLIVDLGRWVFTHACHLLAQELSQLPQLTLSVNISPRHFHERGFAEWVEHILRITGADPKRLILEITEGLFIRDIDATVCKMQHLTRLGIRFSIDDFGTGYSSLAYLKRLPVHELKIDRSFVQDAPHSPGDAALLDSILAVSRHMQLSLVAEGVETREQAEFLNQRGTLLHQGYYYGKPEPAIYWLTQWAETVYKPPQR